MKSDTTLHLSRATLHLSATVDEPEARERLGRLVRRKSRRFLGGSETGALRIELVRLPFLWFRAQVTNRQRQRTLDCLVDRNEKLGHRAPDTVDPASVDDEDVLPGSASVEECRRCAEEHFHRRLAIERASAEEIRIVHIRRASYPYWVGYFTRRRGRADVVLLDAVTGQATGGAAKRAFLSAISAADAAERHDDSDPSAHADGSGL